MDDTYKALIFLVIVLGANYFISIFVSLLFCSNFGFCNNLIWGFLLFFPVAFIVGYIWYLATVVLEKKTL